MLNQTEAFEKFTANVRQCMHIVSAALLILLICLASIVRPVQSVLIIVAGIGLLASLLVARSVSSFARIAGQSYPTAYLDARYDDMTFLIKLGGRNHFNGGYVALLGYGSWVRVDSDIFVIRVPHGRVIDLVAKGAYSVKVDDRRITYGGEWQGMPEPFGEGFWQEWLDPVEVITK